MLNEQFKSELKKCEDEMAEKSQKRKTEIKEHYNELAKKETIDTEALVKVLTGNESAFAKTQ